MSYARGPFVVRKPDRQLCLERAGAAAHVSEQEKGSACERARDCYSIESMTDRRLILALGRLERAIARVEAGMEAARPFGHDENEALFRLAERHRTLREATESAIDRIDRLLGSH